MKKTYATLKIFLVLLSLVSLKSNAQTYCTISGGSTYDDEIFNVTFGSLNNSSNCSQTGGSGSILNVYSNYTAISAPVVIQGFAYPLSVVVGQCNTYAYSGYVRAWIDYNQNGVFTDPGEQIWTSAYTTFAIAGTTIAAGNITIPASATPGTTRMRITAMESGLPGPCTTPTWGEVEDYNILIITPTPCSGTPGANTVVVTPSVPICPNTSAFLNLSTTYTVIGMTYQWLSSTTSSVGPFTSVSGGTNYVLTTPNLTTTTWYQTLITCTNGNASVVATAAQVQVAGTTTSTVPYYESFEGIIGANKLPNCSWMASATPSVTQTYMGASTANRQSRTGSKFAAFYGYYINGTNYFYTNGIYMAPGITYSASVWFTTEYYGYTNFTEFAIQLGTSQTTTGLVTIASSSPAASAIYMSLSNTFTVASPGLYYVAIKASSNGSYGSQYLSWDDLAITIPCSLNSPTVTMSVSSQTICKGDAVNLTASGATGYSWNTGATTAAISDTPNNSTTYYVVGTNTLTGCSATVASQMITVNESPTILVYTNKPIICAGQSANLTAMGATTYTWNTNANSAVISVSPNTTTTYTVLGANAYNCISTAVQQIQVNPNPTVTVSSNATDPTQICKGEAVTLTGNGASTYSFVSSSLFITAPQAIINPMVTTTYTVIGTNANGCVGATTYLQNVAECTGINELTSGLAGVKVYPSPTSGLFTVELNNGALKTVQVTDLTGRVVMTNSSDTEKVNVNISALANGIYYVKIQSNNAIEVIKIVKN